MGAIALALGGGALLSAGGTIGGALLSQPDDPAVRVSAPGLDTNPNLEAASFSNLLSLGVFNPQSLQRAGPLAQFGRNRGCATR